MRYFACPHDAISHTTQSFSHRHNAIFLAHRQHRDSWDCNIFVGPITIKWMTGITSTCKNSFINYSPDPLSISIKCVLANLAKTTNLHTIAPYVAFHYCIHKTKTQPRKAPKEWVCRTDSLNIDWTHICSTDKLNRLYIHENAESDCEIHLTFKIFIEAMSIRGANTNLAVWHSEPVPGKH